MKIMCTQECIVQSDICQGGKKSTIIRSQHCVIIIQKNITVFRTVERVHICYQIEWHFFSRQTKSYDSSFLTAVSPLSPTSISSSSNNIRRCCVTLVLQQEKLCCCKGTLFFQPLLMIRGNQKKLVNTKKGRAMTVHNNHDDASVLQVYVKLSGMYHLFAVLLLTVCKQPFLGAKPTVSSVLCNSTPILT